MALITPSLVNATSNENGDGVCVMFPRKFNLL